MAARENKNVQQQKDVMPTLSCVRHIHCQSSLKKCYTGGCGLPGGGGQVRSKQNYQSYAIEIAIYPKNKLKKTVQ